MNSTEIIQYDKIGFDNVKYLELEKEAILERMSHFLGTLYLEIGGKFLYDPHAARVLPGFDPEVKKDIILSLGVPFEMIFCVNAKDIETNRMINSNSQSYVTETIELIEKYAQEMKAPLSVVVNLVSEETPELSDYKRSLEQKGFKVYYRYVISGYPDPSAAVSETGYGRDAYVPHNTKLVLVIGPASNSGKMSTCLGQIYHDTKRGINSGYAKYELFPIWNLPLNHPVNLAYEAATVDIGDYNLVDPHHRSAHGTEAVNYNRDVDAFPIVSNLARNIVLADNYMNTYKSPTDMGLNKAGFAITDNAIVATASYEEILRRKEWIREQVRDGKGPASWLEKAEELVTKAESYVTSLKRA